MRVCFYAAVKDRRLFELVEFYRQDIEALEALGHSVRLVNRPADLARADDLYWVWWQTSGVPAVLAARARRRPCVLASGLSGRDPSASGLGAKSVVARMAAGTSLRLADVVLASSHETCAGLARPGVRRLMTGHHAVDTDRYRPGGSEESPPYVLTISHLTPDNVERKRILDVVRAAALSARRAPDLRFVIVGGFEAGTARVQQEIDDLGVQDRVEMVGRVSADEKVRLLRGASLYVQPSQYEAFGVAVAEAMACGKTVVSHAVGAVPEVVGDAGRLLPPAAGAGALADAIVELLDAPEREMLGQRARRRIEQQFNVEVRRTAVRAALEACR